MTKERVSIAVKEGIPFEIKMADGEKYEVTDRSQIALGNTFVVMVDKQDLAHILPLLTMTGISYLRPAQGNQGPS
jgi:ribosomal protein S4E